MNRRIHLASGLVLFAFVTTHLLNHSLGLISLEALEIGRKWFLLLWRTPLGAFVLYGAILTHFLLALWSIYRRRSFRLRPVDWAQLLLGLSIPILLVSHALNTRLAHEVYEQEDTYTLELVVFFVLAPELIYKQMILLLIAWTHGVIGMHQWLRLKPRYRRYQLQALSIAVLLPMAALAGIWATGRDIYYLAADPMWLDQLLTETNRISTDQLASIGWLENCFLAVAGGLLLTVVLLRPVRRKLRSRLGLVQVSYPSGERVTVPLGTTVLEASAQHKIPHASVCGGRGRCSTCRVRIGQGLVSLPPPSASEAVVLKRISAADNVRLACQIRPNQDIAVVPLLPSTTTASTVGPEPDYAQGQEREIVVLFADLRGFTAIAEQKLPYDVVFLLNRYFAAMGSAINRAGGHVDKFIGDGVMALFGLETGLHEASRAAVNAVRSMADELTKLNHLLEHDLPEPLRLGIGLHSGPAIVGKMGYGGTNSLTAVGDTVNAASRLETASKMFGVQLVISQSVARAAGMSTNLFETKKIEVRGRQESLIVHLVPDASKLAMNGG